MNYGIADDRAIIRSFVRFVKRGILEIMKNSGGFAPIVVIIGAGAIILVLAGGGYWWWKGYNELLRNHPPVPQRDESAATVTIMVPDDIMAYKMAINRSDSMDIFRKGFAPGIAFHKKEVNVSSTEDIIRASAIAAAQEIHPQANVIYLKVINGSAYVLLNFDVDGFAGVSIQLAHIRPLIRNTLLQFREIKDVLFEPAPGDSLKDIDESYWKQPAPASTPSFHLQFKGYDVSLFAPDEISSTLQGSFCGGEEGATEYNGTYQLIAKKNDRIVSNFPIGQRMFTTGTDHDGLHEMTYSPTGDQLILIKQLVVATEIYRVFTPLIQISAL